MPTNNDDNENEWSILAQSYDDNLRPRFEQLYNTIADIVVKQVQLNKKKIFKILDYGTGTGEPILTILQFLQTNQLNNVELHATDSSLKMLSIAEDRLKQLQCKQFHIQFSSISSDMYDIITMSLVLPYALSKEEMLHKHFRQLNTNGLLISSHWYRYDQVPFLTIIKGVGSFMATGQHLNFSELEFDSSYSCWQEKQTRNEFEHVGFTIQQWISITLSMSFVNIRALLNFCNMSSWFNDDKLYIQAEHEAKRILNDICHVQLSTDGSFQLSNTAIIVVASKSS